MSLWQGKQILITGGAGFIGSHLAQQLNHEAAHVTILDPHASPDNPNLMDFASSLQLWQSRVEEALGNFDVSRFDFIFHLGGNPYVPPSVENPLMDYEKNLQTTFRLLECLRAKPKARLIYASSAAVYGNPAKLPVRESDPTFPISPYGVSKLASERYVAVYSQLYGIRGSSVRMFSVYGAKQRKQVIFDIFQKLLANPTSLEVLGDGSQQRDFCYVTDAVNALMQIAEKAPAKGEVYNVASGHSHSINEIIAIWTKLLRLNPHITYTGQSRAGDPEKWSADISALKALGFSPQLSLEQGIAKLKAWYDEQP